MAFFPEKYTVKDQISTDRAQMKQEIGKTPFLPPAKEIYINVLVLQFNLFLELLIFGKI